MSSMVPCTGTLEALNSQEHTEQPQRDFSLIHTNSRGIP